MITFNILVALFVCINASMAIKTLQEFFNEDFNDLTIITWDHAVNDQAALNEALKNKKYMIEADIIFSNTGEAVMGHNAGDPYDITFEQFLKKIIEANKENPRKGLKLDFKSSEAFNSAVVIMNNLIDQLNFPLWLNGDIVGGPGSNKTGVNLTSINEHVSKYANVIMSLGWTTGDFNSEEAETNYNDFIKPMRTVLMQSYYQILLSKVAITFPVRAMYIALTCDAKIDELLVNTNDTLTIWSGKQDTEFVNIDKLKKLINGNKNKIFLDVPDDLKEKLDGDSLIVKLD